jgi:hypothetical protein
MVKQGEELESKALALGRTAKAEALGLHTLLNWTLLFDLEQQHMGTKKNRKIKP